MTSPSQEDIVKRVQVGGRSLLWYKAPVIQVAVLRGTTADTDGNISFEREAMFCDNLNQVGRRKRDRTLSSSGDGTASEGMPNAWLAQAGDHSQCECVYRFMSGFQSDHQWARSAIIILLSLLYRLSACGAF